MDLTQEAAASGTVSPQSWVNNQITLYFEPSADCTVTLSVTHDGATNVGNDAVALRLRRVQGTGVNETVVQDLFNLFAQGQDGGGQLSMPLNLLGGERYKLFASGEARAFEGTSPTSSFVRATLIVPEPSGLAMLALGGIALLRRR